MRDDRDENFGQGAPEVSVTKTVRFSALVAAGGKPELYLPLFDPNHDRGFIQAAKQHRVLSIRQEPTSKKADFGIVGYDERKHTSYLVFPRSLRRFANARVVGIKYDMIGETALPKCRTRVRPKTRRNAVKKGAGP
jgi:hypothetical protein